MGRIFEKRKDRMFARWAKNAKAFTKLGKEIALAVKLSGEDPNGNPRLRLAIQTARSLNMPKDRIEAAIHRAASKDEAELQEIVYDAYGPNGVALVIESATNNPTRTVANVRSILGKHGGTLASNGALNHIFQRRGVFTIATPAGGSDDLQLELIEHGLEDIVESDDQMLLFCSFENFGSLQRTLEEKKIEVKSASLQRIPLSTLELSDDQEQTIEALIEALEDDDDVQHVYHNV